MLTTGTGGGVVGGVVGSDVGGGDGDSAGAGSAVKSGGRVGVAATTAGVFSGLVVGVGRGVNSAEVLQARVNRATNNMVGNLMVYLKSSNFSTDITTCKEIPTHHPRFFTSLRMTAIHFVSRSKLTLALGSPRGEPNGRALL
jgi:hypothetical protein